MATNDNEETAVTPEGPSPTAVTDESASEFSSDVTENSEGDASAGDDAEVEGGGDEQEAEEAVSMPPAEIVEDCPPCKKGSPAWMATFADMATLLMAFFVLLLSFAEVEIISKHFYCYRVSRSENRVNLPIFNIHSDIYNTQLFWMKNKPHSFSSSAYPVN